MSSTFLGLNTAYSGLQAANAALNTTANNISNAETKGYSRQTVTTQAADAIRSFTTYGCVGAGVETLAIERVRDKFYDEKFWTNNTKLGEYESKQYYMSCIEEYFCDDDSIKGFTSIFNEFYGTIEELAKNPGDATNRQQTIAYANNVCTYFNDMYGSLRKLQDDANQEISVNIDRINAIAEEVASLNKQINVIEMNSGAMANELRDQRDLLIDELSEIVKVEIDEVPIIDTNDTSRDTGGTRYLVKICGQNIVDGNYYKTFTCVPRTPSEASNLSDIDGLYDVYFAGDNTWTPEDYHNKGVQLNMYTDTVGGKLGGLIAIRDGNNGEGFEGKVTNISGVANNAAGLPIQKVEITVDKSYLQDLTKLNLTTSGGIVSIAGGLYHFDSWEYDPTKSTYTFDVIVEKGVTVPDSAVANSVSANVGPSIKYQGVPYYLGQMNEWVRKFSENFNDILAEGVLDEGVDADGNPIHGPNLFTALDKDGNEIPFLADKKYGEGYNNIIGSRDLDNYYQLTAGNFRVADELIKSPSKLATRSERYEGQEQNDIVNKLISLKTNSDQMSFRGCSADQFLVCMLSDVSLNAQRANDFTSNYTVLKNSIENQRLAVSGVDNDEEAVNLTKFQQQYNMASKMISVLKEVYDRLILQTGV